ncbi:hypothetical protein LAJ19_03980 [Deinococcus taeanensis]|uniref:hypothetical protein n=1 Tax=Deinococcus taeanensis TaxID=2737050 RepID=UPI001CDC65E8|nr:hypothetical protein [Deinococcus taeanensis]UBV43380.1 hypothetical protein LAJ19_03980 [Deinococcus taeanensis]
MRLLPLTAALLASLTACTSVQPGTADYVPLVQTSAASVARLAPGQTLYVQYRYPRNLLEEDQEYDQYFDALAFDYSPASRVNGNVPSPVKPADWLKLQAVEAPKGVTINVQKVNVVREVTKTTDSDSGVNVKYYEVFRVTYKITAAADAKTGVDTAKVTFNDGKRTPDVMVFLNVTQ